MNNAFLIPEDNKDKFIKMCLLLFPRYKSGQFKNNGIITLRYKQWWKRSSHIHFYNLISLNIVNELSILRWNSYDLVKMFKTNIMSIIKSSPLIDTTVTVGIIDYLYTELLRTKLRDIYSDGSLSKILTPLDTIEEAVIIENSEILSTSKSNSNISLRRKLPPIEQILRDIRLMAASTILIFLLNVSAAMFSLTKIIHIVTCPPNTEVFMKFPWITNYP